ncbi:MAG: DUF1446 domain-containing protein [Alphaproteobacteria bacterium]|nr:DUF1446 domain-containing protein [Alphaproteobacteria bacterium]
MAKRTVYIGCGAGFAGDRWDAAVPVVATLARRDGPRYLMFETLAERTLALAQQARIENPEAGYSQYLERYVRPVMRDAKAAGIRIVSNFGAANPLGGARKLLAMAREEGIDGLKVAVVDGDDLTAVMTEAEIRDHAPVEGLDMPEGKMVAANVYLGAQPIAEALALGADIVVVGRCSDPALALGPLLHEFGWPLDDLDRIAAGTLAGHLLECGAQVTGGYFADPGFKDVPDFGRVGFPIAEVTADGAITITKADDTGGLVSHRTVKEQILYEMHDPSAYLTPDVTLDITGVTVKEVGPDRVSVTGARGKPMPPTLKATLSFEGGWLGEGEITYAGPNARRRAELAIDVLRERARGLGTNWPLRFDLIGTVATFDGDDGDLRAGRDYSSDGEYRVRMATRGPDKQMAQWIADEVLSLYCSGPAGGAGVRHRIAPQVTTASILIDRARVNPTARLVEETA